MPHTSPPHQSTYDRLSRDFGEPHNKVGQDHQWSLRPPPLRVSIHILLDGHLDKPVIWVFDPHSEYDGVFRAYVEGDDQLEEIIQMVHARIKAAADRNRSA